MVVSCLECKEFICMDCKDSNQENLTFKEMSSPLSGKSIVNHFVMNRLEEGYPCGCGKLF